ncbi:pyridoxamine 5'-phosphate oxidase family protein [Mangrovicoccus sp. HB161399]|uniref:pyridoxamine 5'-phosphate oxidase family protein n=1 Tax=Mangrovicoccus sp. HB161399 TaxID=2720392 RepID=UPI001555F14F
MSAGPDIVFTDAVKAQQAGRGARGLHARAAETRPWPDAVTPDPARSIEAQASVFLGTAGAEGQPCIQHRGGPPGDLEVLDGGRLGAADRGGNRQCITLGNLSGNPRAVLFPIDHAGRQRIKIWGRAQVVEDDPELLARLGTGPDAAKAVRATLFGIEAWDATCPQYIPRRFDETEVENALRFRDARIAELEARLAQMAEAGGG